MMTTINRRGSSRERVFDYMKKQLLSGQPPTIRDVQLAMDFRSVESARKHLDTLVREGRLLKRPGRSRGYRLPAGQMGSERKEALRLIPVVGDVQAGDLTLALESPEGYLRVEGYSPDSVLFALRIRGTSMIGAGLLPDDLVIVRQRSHAAHGDIVVALVGDEATVKRLKINGNRIELHPENPEFEPLIPAIETLEILGKVIEVRRFLT